MDTNGSLFRPLGEKERTPSAIRPFRIPAPTPYHVLMHTQPSGAGQPLTASPLGGRRLAVGARDKPRELPGNRRQHAFLRELKRVGTPSAGRRDARVSYFDDERLRRRLREAKLPFGKRLEGLIPAIDALWEEWRRELERATGRASSAN